MADFESSYKLKIDPQVDPQAYTKIANQIDKAFAPLKGKIDPIDEAEITSALKTIKQEAAKAGDSIKGIGDGAGAAGKQAGKDFGEKFSGETIGSIKSAKGKFETMGKEAGEEYSSGFSSTIKDFAIGSILGDAVSAGLGKLTETLTALPNALKALGAEANVTGKELEELGEIAKGAFTQGVGDSIEDAAHSIAFLKKQLGELKDASGGQLIDVSQYEEAAVYAQRLADAHGVSYDEIISKSRTLMANYKMDFEETFDLIAYGLANAGNSQEDFLDTLDEYSPLLKQAGVDVYQFAGTLSAAMREGVWNTDKLADSLKETQVRINAGDWVKPFEDMANAADGASKQVILSIQDILTQAQNGDINIADALGLSAEAIKNAVDAGEISTALQDQLAVAIGGTMAEDIGGDLWAKIFSADVDPLIIKEQARKAGQIVQDALKPISFEEFTRKIELAFAEIGNKIAPVLDPIFTKLSDKLIPALDGVIDTLDPFIAIAGEVLELAVDLLPVIAAGATAFGTYKAAVTGVTAATKLFSGALAANPVGAAIVGITALLAITKQLAGAFHETAEERLDEIQAQKEIIQQDKQMNEAKQAQIKANVALVEEYEKLSKKQKLSREEQERLKLVTQELRNEFPGAIKSTDDWATNMKRLSERVADSKSELAGLIANMKELNKQEQRTLELEVSVKADKAKGDIEDALTEVQSEANGLFSDLSNSFDEAILGGSNVRAWSENFLDPYVKEMYRATSSGELQDARDQLLQALDVRADEKGYDKAGLLNTRKAINEFYDALLDKQRFYQAKTGEINEEIKTDVEQNTPKPPPVGDPKEYDSLKEAIKKSLQEIAQLQNDLSNNQIKDELDRQIAMQQEKIRIAVEGVQDEIQRTKELDNVRNSEREELIKNLNTKIGLLTEQGEAEINKIKESYWDKQLETIRSRNQEIYDAETKALEQRLAIAETQAPQLTGDDSVANLQEQGQLRIQLIERQTDAEVSAILERNQAYLEAQDALNAATQTFGDDSLIVKIMQDQLSEIKEKIISETPEIANLFAELDQKINEVTADVDLKIKEERINQIRNLAVREREIRIFEAEKLYQEQLAKAKGNQQQELQALKGFLAEKKAAEEKYLNDTNVLYSISSAFRDALFNADYSGNKDQGLLDDLNKQLETNKTASLDLEEQLRNREISIEEYYEKVNGLAEEQLELEKQQAEARKAAQVDVFAVMSKAAGEAFKKISQQQLELSASYQNDLDALAEQQEDNAEKIAETQLNMAKAINDGKLAEAERYYEQLAELQEGQMAVEEQIAETESAMLQAKVTGYATMFSQIGMEQQNWSKAFVKTAFSALKAEIPIYAAEALAKALALNPITGAIVGGIAAGLMYAALAGVESAVMGAFAEGTVDLKGKGTTKSDSNLSRLSIHESVMNAEATLATGNKEAFEWVNKHKRPLSEYFVDKFQQDINLQKKLQNKLKPQSEIVPVLVRGMSEQNTAQAINRQTAELRADNQNLRSELAATRKEIRALQTKINTNLNIEFDGEMKADGDSLRGQIDAWKRKELKSM